MLIFFWNTYLPLFSTVAGMVDKTVDFSVAPFSARFSRNHSVLEAWLHSKHIWLLCLMECDKNQTFFSLVLSPEGFFLSSVSFRSISYVSVEGGFVLEMSCQKKHFCTVEKCPDSVAKCRSSVAFQLVTWVIPSISLLWFTFPSLISCLFSLQTALISLLNLLF